MAVTDRVKGAPRDTCVWRPSLQVDVDVWEGDCGITWELTTGTPDANGMHYCPRYGGKLKLVKL